MASRGLRVSVAVVIGLLIAGCGGGAAEEAAVDQEAGGASVDVDAIESNLAKLAADSGGDEVACPDDVPAEAGGTFECSVSGPEAEGSIAVTLDDAEGKAYSYEGKISGAGGLETELSGSAR